MAEVIIVIGIIGIIAEMTIPTLVKNSAKQVTISKLQKFYSVMFQAISISELDNGPTNSWTYGTPGDGSQTLIWFNTYLAPYIKSTSAEVYAPDNRYVLVKLQDGVTVIFFNAAFLDFHVYLDGNLAGKMGRTVFFFELDKTATMNAFKPYDATFTGTDRAKWTTGANACTAAGKKYFCAGLIMADGWRILSDYPW